MDSNVTPMPMGVCAGCGDRNPNHPWVAVMADDSGRFVARPVCGSCHSNPSRRIFPIKGHFFPRHQAAEAVRMAGGSSIG